MLQGLACLLEVERAQREVLVRQVVPEGSQSGQGGSRLRECLPEEKV